MKRLSAIMAAIFYISILPPLTVNAAAPVIGDLIVKDSPYKDVRAHSLACDNTANDAPAFDNVLSSLSSGSTVLVKGMCAVGSASWTGFSVTGKNDIRFIGADERSGFRVLVTPSQTIQTGGGPTPALFLWEHSSNITFANLTFDGSGTTQEVFIGVDNVSSPKFYRNRFLNTAINLYTVSPAIQAYRTTDMDVSFNTFDNVQFGAAAGGGANPAGSNVYGANYRSRFIGNTFINFDRDGIIMGSDDQLAQGNTFYNTLASVTGGAGIITVGTWVDGVYRGPRNTTIVGNTFKDLTWPGIQSDIVQAAGTSSGYFTEGITITGNTFDNVGVNAFYALNVRGAIFSNNTVRGGPTPITIVNGDNVVITGNRFTGFTAQGINITVASASYYARNIIISNNMIYTAATNQIGIALSVVGETARIDNVSILGNQIDTHGYNIYAYDNVFNLMIANNTLTANAGAMWNMFLTDTNYSTYGGGNIVGLGASTGGSIVLLETFGNGNRRGYGTAAPEAGTWKVGDLWYNTGADNVILWKCTVAGTPGTWDNLAAAF